MRALQPVQSLCMYPKVQQMARVARHTAARAARPGKGAQHNGCNKAHAHLLHCPKACSAKAASAVLQMLAEQPPVFVPCSVFRVPCSVFRVPCSVLGALQPLPLQSKAHDVKTSNRLLADASQGCALAWPLARPLQPIAPQPHTQPHPQPRTLRRTQ